MLSTSPLPNKVIVIYNKHFFNTVYNTMDKYDAEFFKDSSDTVWHIKDVAKILLTPTKRKA